MVHPELDVTGSHRGPADRGRGGQQQVKRRRKYHRSQQQWLSKSVGGALTGPPSTAAVTLAGSWAPHLLDAPSGSAGGSTGLQAEQSQASSHGSPLRSPGRGAATVPHELAMQLEARRKLLEANPDIMERRKALSQSAFVRHDAAEMMGRLQLAAAWRAMQESGSGTRHSTDISHIASAHRGTKSAVPGHVFSGHTPGRAPPQPSTCSSSMSLTQLQHDPGHALPALESSAYWLPSLATHSLPSSPAAHNHTPSAQELHDAQVAQAVAQLDCRSVPATPIALRRTEAGASFTPLVPGTLNGIGHPLLNDRLLLPPSAMEPPFVLKHRHLGSLSCGGSTEPHGNVLSPGKQQNHYKSLSELVAEDSHHRQSSNSQALLLLPRSGTLPSSQPEHKANRPLSEDTLNLWRGKRLNLTEMKIEARLHRLRNNPTARTELQGHVESLLAAKADEVAEVAAQQLFASELREQKALTFLKRQAQYQPTGSKQLEGLPPTRRPVVLTGVAALFDPQNGDPVDDPHPLPPGQARHWAGYVMLSKVLHALSSCLHASTWARGQLGVQDTAATTIQATWKGYQARKMAKTIRARKEYLARTSRKMRLGLSDESAAQLIIQFLKDYDLAGRRGSAAAALRQVASHAGHEKARAELVRSMRVAMLVRQWSLVEAAAIELCRKRARGNAVLGISSGPAGSSASVKRTAQNTAGNAASQKRLQPPSVYAEDREAVTQAAVEDALARTTAADRIIADDCEPVPQAVKAAIVAAFMEYKQTAYMQLVGLVWKARAQWKSDRRREDLRKAAHGVMSEGSTAAAQEEQLPQQPGAEPSSDGPSLAPRLSLPASSPQAVVDLTRPVGEGQAQALGVAEVAEAPEAPPGPSRQLEAEGSSTSLGKGAPRLLVQVGSGPAASAAAATPRRAAAVDRKFSSILRENPRLPPFRILATPMEMKAVMQQGVQEAAAFTAYLTRGSKASQPERKVPVGAASKKASYPGARVAASDAAQLHQQHASSFSVALLLHRWKSECMPRAHACLPKRFSLLKVNLAECHAASKVWSCEEMGQQLQNLVVAT